MKKSSNTAKTCAAAPPQRAPIEWRLSHESATLIVPSPRRLNIRNLTSLTERAQSLNEEIANSVSHGIGLLAILVAAPFLVINAAERGGTAGVVGAWVFATTASALYLASAIYHALPPNRVKEIFRVVDHAAIYLLIAGTYTPFTLGVLRGTVGWSLFALIWALALGGILWKVFLGVRYKTMSTALYLIMGWVALVAVVPLLDLIPTPGLLWILAGGLGYTFGVPFYVLQRKRYCHFVWHLFVLAGTSCHFVAVFLYSS